MASAERREAWSSLHDDATVLARPLCVDLDGTLIATDTLGESVLILLRQRPWLVFLMPFWLLAGRARFKRIVATHVLVEASTLPYRSELLEALRQSRARGRKLVLATAADRAIADRVAGHLALFDEVFASDGAHNLKAKNKRDRLRTAYGDGGFDYVGDSEADLDIFESAAQGYLVAASRDTVLRAQKLGRVTVLSERPSLLRALLKQLRVHQWAKNALVVLPVVLAKGVPPLDMIVHAVLAALAFSLSASAGYVFNDLLDLEADRAHHTKRARPLASGALPVLFGPPLFVALLVSSFALSLAVQPFGFTVMLAIYFVGTMAYSLQLKRRLLLDVLVLAGLYTHRILAGGIATGVPISAWLLGFSMFFFLSLAFAKRYVELRALTAEKIKNRNYYKADLQMVVSMGPSAGYIAALVFCVYVESGGAVKAAYREPVLLWLIVPLLLYWVSRVWILAGRGEMQDDPVRFAVKDPVSLVCALGIGSIAALARFTPEWIVVLFQ